MIHSSAFTGWFIHASTAVLEIYIDNDWVENRQQRSQCLNELIPWVRRNKYRFCSINWNQIVDWLTYGIFTASSPLDVFPVRLEFAPGGLGLDFPFQALGKIPTLARIDRWQGLFTKYFFSSHWSHIYGRSQKRWQVTHWSLQVHSRFVLKCLAKENTFSRHLPLYHLDNSI